MESMHTARLLRRCASGDPAPWQELAERFRDRLEAGVRRALRRAGNAEREDQIEDLLQEVYCRLLERDRRVLTRFRGSSDGEAACYLARVAESVTFDALRLQAAAKRGGGATTLDAALLAAAPAPGPTPEERCLARERCRGLAARLAAAAGGRRVATRNLWVLRKILVEGWSSGEVAQALGGTLRASSIDSMVARVRQRLARQGLRMRRRPSRRRTV